MPEASPDSSGLTSLIAASSSGFIAIPIPTPRMTMAGRTSTAKLASTGARAKSASPAATNPIPATRGSRVP